MSTCRVICSSFRRPSPTLPEQRYSTSGVPCLLPAVFNGFLFFDCVQAAALNGSLIEGCPTQVGAAAAAAGGRFARELLLQWHARLEPGTATSDGAWWHAPPCLPSLAAGGALGTQSYTRMESASCATHLCCHRTQTGMCAPTNPPTSRPLSCSSETAPPDGEQLEPHPGFVAGRRPVCKVDPIISGNRPCCTQKSCPQVCAFPHSPYSATEALNRTGPGPEGSLCPIVPSSNSPNANCNPNLTCVPLPEAGGAAGVACLRAVQPIA